ncbi:MAG: hypothetical protein O3A85_02090 [Proteobacteria bacterium]|nr:hypothetical protein [Pseudomonadota bacterium]
MQTGIPFVQFLLTIAGAVTAALGLALWALESGRDEELTPSRRRLGESWRMLSQAPWRDIIPCITGWLVKKTNDLIRSFFQEADQGIAFGGVVFIILFIFIPLAAALNALFGGSSFLFWYYGTLLAALAFLNVSGETGRLRIVSSMVAVYLGLSFFVVIPVYVLQSFTEVTINSIFSHSVLKSLLVAIIWYVAAYGAGVLIDTWFRSRGIDPVASPTARFINQFLAALPVAYVLTFFALLAGHFGVLEQSPARSWRLVLASTGLTALSLPTTLLILGLGAKNRSLLPVWYLLALFAIFDYSVLVAIVAYAGTDQSVTQTGVLNVLIGLTQDGKAVYMGPQFWILHLPFLPLVVFFLGIGSGFIVKGVIRGVGAFSGPAFAFDQPYLASAFVCAGWALVFWGVALLLKLTFT